MHFILELSFLWNERDNHDRNKHLRRQGNYTYKADDKYYEGNKTRLCDRECWMDVIKSAAKDVLSEKLRPKLGEGTR